MATYKGINGFAVQSLATDPSPSDEGQVWYNNATYAFKLAAATTVGTWASGGNLPTITTQLGGAGIQTAALAFGGNSPAGTFVAAAYKYDGTSWTSTGSLNTARRGGIGGAGIQTSALAFGGYSTANSSASESFNGSTWTSTPSLNTARTAPGGCGASNTSALAFGGDVTYGAQTATELWNGSSWTNNPTGLNTARSSVGGCGTQTAALAAGGINGGPSGSSTTSLASTESYNGSIWTSVSSMNTGRYGLGLGGTQTLALGFGGNAYPLTGATESWNGTSWTTLPATMATPRTDGWGGGTQASAIYFGGATPGGNQNATEEFTGAGAPVTRTITTS
jgi:hypothetical protein